MTLPPASSATISDDGGNVRALEKARAEAEPNISTRSWRGGAGVSPAPDKGGGRRPLALYRSLRDHIRPRRRDSRRRGERADASYLLSRRLASLAQNTRRASASEPPDVEPPTMHSPAA